MLENICSSSSEGDRFFVALYRKMLDAGLKTSAKHPQFLNLIYRSMKADVCDKRVKVGILREMKAKFSCDIWIEQVLKNQGSFLLRCNNVFAFHF